VGTRALNEEQVSNDEPDWWSLQQAGAGDHRQKSGDTAICWRLRNRVDELEEKLQLRTILLAFTTVLCVVLGTLTGDLYYNNDRLTGALAVAPPANTSSGLEGDGPSERSELWAMGEKWIEANALLHFDAHGSQAPTGTTTWVESGGTGALTEASVNREMRDHGSEASGHDCSPMAHDSIVTTSLTQHEFVLPEALEQEEYTVTDFVYLRAAPNSSARVLTVVAQGDLVRRTGHDLGWLQVQYGDPHTSDLKGWVYSGHLRRVGTSGELRRPVPTRAAADPFRREGSTASSGGR
jgi:hypothetical protein